MKKLIRILLFVFLVTASLPTQAFAQTADMADFTVRAILPENQLENENTYFDLRMKPGQRQTLQVEVYNAADAAIVLDVSLNAASTNRNGIIEYLIERTPDETLRFPFHSIAQTQPEVTLAPKEQKRIAVEISMPEEEFDGTILGGILFSKRPQTEQTQGVGIHNQFSYVIGVRLTETDEIILPDFDLKSVQETLVNYRTAVLANIRNTEPVIVKGAKASAQVYLNNGQTPLFTVEKDNVDFAPNSVFPLPVEWEGTRLEAGSYRMSVQLTHEHNRWAWDQDFTISPSQANDINNGAITPTPQLFQGLFQNVFFLGAVVLLLLLLLFLAFYIGRRSRRTRKTRED